MILVGQFDSPFVRRVAVTLNHYHMPYTRNPISVFRDVGEMQKINPLVRVPSLILETGEVLIDSSAIIDHLDEMAGPARALTPAHGPERRKVMQAIVLALGALELAQQERMCTVVAAAFTCVEQITLTTGVSSLLAVRRV